MRGRSSRFGERVSLTLAVVFLAALPAQAAFISIDDSDPDFITITAGDFEGGFSVGGTLLTSGLSDSGSITLPDGGYTIYGLWIDLGESVPGARVDLLFALLSAPTDITSGIEFGYTTDGLVATLGGTFGGFLGAPYFTAALPTVTQDGHTDFAAAPFLSVSFKSEAPAGVPEPSTLMLLGLALPGLGLAHHRHRRRA